MHVLHASLLEAPWSAASHSAHGFVYDSGAQHALLGDWILTVLLAFAAPEQAHVLMVVLASWAVVLSVFAFLRAYGTRIGPSILWLAPITFNTLLIMGMFHFLIGTAIALGSVAWWKWHAGSPRARWAGLLIGAVITVFTHRGAPFLLGLFFFTAVLHELYLGRTAAAPGDRGISNGRIVIWIVLLLACAFALGRRMQILPLLIPAELPSFTSDFLLRPLFLVDHADELWLVQWVGILFLIAIVAGIIGRWRFGRKLLWHDMLAVLFFAFFAIAFLGNTPYGRSLIISDRGQWLVLVVLVLWVVAIADASRGRVASIIGGAALCALPLHVVRLVQAEAYLSHFEGAYNATMEACDALAPGSLVLSVPARTDRLLQHVVSYVAIRHNGILIAPYEQLNFVEPNAWTGQERWCRFARDPYWVQRHWRRGIPPEVDQVLFIGDGIEQNVGKHPWPSLLKERYKPVFDNGHARIYTSIPTGGL